MAMLLPGGAIGLGLGGNVRLCVDLQIAVMAARKGPADWMSRRSMSARSTLHALLA